MGNVEDIEGLHTQDTMSDFSTPVEVKYPDECIENSDRISLDELRSSRPDVADLVDRMNERLGNDCPDGIMNTLEYYESDNNAIIIKSNNPDYANSMMVVKGDDVYCKGGCLVGDQHPNEFINEARLIPNATYHIDGHFNYRTDDLGRVTQSNELITDAGEIERHGERGNLKPIADAKDGRTDDVGGHIVANNICGPTEAINIFPQNGELNNSGEWKHMENDILNAALDGSSIVVSKEFTYTADSMRPDSISVTTDIDGNVTHYEFANESPSTYQGTNEGLFVLPEGFVQPAHQGLSSAQYDYLSECDDVASLVERIDEINDCVPAKAVDSNKDCAEIIAPIKDCIDVTLLEAPSDSVQIESISDTLHEIKELDYSEWAGKTIEEKYDALQLAENSIAEIEHRPACEIKLHSIDAHGYFDPETKTITINTDEVNLNDFHSYKEVLDTLIHEGRHAYQDYNLTERQVHPRLGEVANWQYNEHEVGYLDCQTFGYELYAIQPVEADAQAFAGDVIKKFLEA